MKPQKQGALDQRNTLMCRQYNAGAYKNANATTANLANSYNFSQK